jgi:hypothetical protein
MAQAIHLYQAAAPLFVIWHIVTNTNNKNDIKEEQDF